MAFSEYVKKEVLQKAGYFCCVCHKSSVSVEVHHITPQAQGGDDSIENAAPLCPNCHSDYGGNAEKRKRIKQIRDWWYEKVQEIYSSKVVGPDQMDRIHSLLQDVRNKQNYVLARQDEHMGELQILKSQLKEVANKAIDNMSFENSDMTASSVISTAVSSISSLKVASCNWNMKCQRCNNSVSSSANYCPYCGNSMR